MPNLSQLKRQRMLAFLRKIREEHTDDESLIAINEIETELTSKKYGLVWEEHEERVDVEMHENVLVFTEVADREIVSNGSLPYNFLLEGDNLHSLKLLEKTHKGRIDAIYIDPPYNRGKDDFVYDDNYIVTEDAYRHSKWISFMKERLDIAQRLLSAEGMIFISIDDNEMASLKMLCDEVFGESNFINLFVWQRNSSAKTEKGKFTVNTEYILLYTKSSQCTLNDAYKPLSKASMKLFKFDDGDGRGKYQTVSLQKPRDPGPETTYDYVDHNGKVWKCPPKGWRMKYEKIKALENDNRLVLSGKTLRVKDYWNERENEGKRIDTLWNDLSQNTAGSGELELVMGMPNTFNNPKPTDLIKRCLRIASPNGYVLDFFAGSGTTGQAVLELNTEDNGTRKFILCTNNENGICEKVTYHRTKTVITGTRQDGSVYSAGIPANLKYYKTSFIPKISEDSEYSLNDELLKYIAEMVQLEYAVKLDGTNYILVMSDDEADRMIADKDRLKDCKALYVSAAVLLTGKQQKELFDRGIDLYMIPDYYFETELLEVGER